MVWHQKSNTAAAIADKFGSNTMNSLQKFKHLVLSMFLLAPCGAAWADWELDNTKSVVNFISIKNDSVGEVHSFASLVGFIGATGNVQMTINLDSVETLVDVRNQRMRELLFETVKFPSAQLTAQADPAVLAEAAKGGVVTADLPVILSLHGKVKTLTIAVVVVGEGDGSLRVFTARPVLINAADFGLENGVTALQQVAALKAISTVVPVTLQLRFVQAK
jgi:polyisoprenoid-binding protein YceI